MLAARLTRALGQFSLDLTLEVSSGSTLVLVGTSGSGKTTILRLLAGLLDPDSGHIALDGDTWFSSADRLALPAWRRPVGYVAQDYSLFPHLSVLENVGFGLRALGERSSATTSRVGGILEQLAIGDLAGRRPHQLSGGQQQRVAIARSLVLEPRLLLLDEPLSALDLQTRREMRVELRRLLARLPCVTVYVTHNPVEAMVFGDRVAVLNGGRVDQIGTGDELLRHPRSPFVAEFAGVNLFRGTLGKRDGTGLALLRTPDGELSVLDSGEGDEVFVSVDPREITLHCEAPAGSAQNVFFGPVSEIVPEPPYGERVRVALDSHPPMVAEVTRSAVESLGLREGLRIYAAFKATGIVPYR